MRKCRDIKPENFLLKYKGDITNVKMIDFGLSNDYSELQVMQTPVGSVRNTYYLYNSLYSLITLPQRSLINTMMQSVICGQWE